MGIGGSEAGVTPGALESWDWTEWIANVCGRSGWMWDAIDDRTIPELTALAKAWAKFPPLPAVMAALIGHEADDPAPSSTPSPGPTPEEKAWLRQQMFAVQQSGGGVSKQVLAALEA